MGFNLAFKGLNYSDMFRC